MNAWRQRSFALHRAWPFFLVWEALSMPHTLWIIFKSSAFIHKKPIRLPSNYMLILCSMCTNWQQQDSLLKSPVALKVLVWSRGPLVTLKILTSSSFSPVEETHGSLGQCVSFFLIDVGGDLIAYVVFLYLFFFLGDIVCLVRGSEGKDVFRCWFDHVHDPEFTAACSYDICFWVSGIGDKFYLVFEFRVKFVIPGAPERVLCYNFVLILFLIFWLWS